MLEGLLFNFAVIAIGFLLLSKAASEAIKRAIPLARHWGFSEFVVSFLFIGLVAILPELVIGIISALSGAPSFGAGVVIGSNIADLTLIVGLVAVLTNGISLENHTFGDMKKLVLFIALPLVLFLDGELSRIDGLALIISFIIYLFFMLRKSSTTPTTELGHNNVYVAREIVFLLGAVIVMIFSAYLITDAAKQINSALALPIFFVGIMVAIGTCTPELIVSVKSNRQKHGELGLGDILGNVFADCLLTLGIIALVAPIKPGQPLLVITSFFLVIFSMITLLVLSKSENRISKDEGIYLIVLYFFFLAIQFGLEQIITNNI
ncbi:MAG: sodium:calcium antiporter [archaeon]|nr:sodium:calcium antiporter [archaeon]